MMEQLLTFREAGDQLGINKKILKRLLKNGELPEAEKIRRPEGWIWVLPENSLTEIAKRPDLVLDVTDRRSEATLTFKDIAEEMNKTTNIQEPEPVSVDQPSEAIDIEDNLDLVTPPAEEAEIKDIEETENNSQVRHLSLAKSSNINLSPLDATPSPLEAQSHSEVIDILLLNKLLLLAQEAKAEASVRAEQAEYALEVSKASYSSAEEEITVSKQELSATSERLREERIARKLSDAKIADLNEQLIREISLAETERKQRTEATNNLLEAEKKAVQALTSMGWISRKRYRKSLNRD